MLWDSVLKLFLLKKVLTGSDDSAWDPLKKSTRWKMCKTHFPNSHLVTVWLVLKTADVRVYFFLCRSHVLFTGLVNTDFSKFFFKTGSHDTIHTVKNYFVTVFSVFSNKRYPNKSLN